MKLSEIKIDQLALSNEYIKYLRDNSKYTDDQFGSHDIDLLCHEPGNCSMISDHFVSWLNGKGVHAKMITGLVAKNPKWAKTAKVLPNSEEDAHTVVLVGDKIVDLTARQFDKAAAYPKITTLNQFKSEWKHIKS